MLASMTAAPGCAKHPQAEPDATIKSRLSIRARALRADIIAKSPETNDDDGNPYRP